MGLSQQARIGGGLIEVSAITKRQRRYIERRQRHPHLHIKAKILFLFKEEIKNKLPHEVGVQCVINHLRPSKLEETETEWRDIKQHANSSVHLAREKGNKYWRVSPDVMLLLWKVYKFTPSKYEKQAPSINQTSLD